MVLSIAMSAILSMVVNIHICATWGPGGLIVSIVLTLPVCLTLLIGALHGPYIIGLSASKLADKLLAMGSRHKKG